MVKVLENQVVDLDVMPGKKPEDIQAQAQQQVQQAGNQLKEASGKPGEEASAQVENAKEQLKAASEQLPEEQQKQVGGILDKVQNVGGDAAGT
ncbi:MAG: hypothetical protein M1835_004628, partial [Candelina submexicana]